MKKLGTKSDRNNNVWCCLVFPATKSIFGIILSFNKTFQLFVQCIIFIEVQIYA